jgi:hypothetical protein
MLDMQEVTGSSPVSPTTFPELVRAPVRGFALPPKAPSLQVIGSGAHSQLSSAVVIDFEHFLHSQQPITRDLSRK